MRILIIEDEPYTAQSLHELLSENDEVDAVQTVGSVAEGLKYLRRNESTDLIFADIQLGDGTSFDIFREEEPAVPVIFCTAYDEHAIEAFQHFGIGYVLKPFSRTSINKALARYQALQQTTAPAQQAAGNSLLPPVTERLNSSLLVNRKEKIIPIKINECALFFIDYKMTQLITANGDQFVIPQALDELENLCGQQFFRANRQYLVNREIIREVSHYNARKLILHLDRVGTHEVIISKNRVADFLEWLRR